MLLKTLFMNLYPLVGIISVCAYLPQIKMLIKTNTPPVNISIKSWSLWIVSSSISLGYGIYCLKDSLFIIMTVIALILTLCVVTIVIHKRYVIFGNCKNLPHAILIYYFVKPYFGVPKYILTKEDKLK